MRPISIKLDEEQIAAIDAEAEEQDLTRSQYLRRIIDARHETTQPTVEEKIERLDETVTDLSTRVRELERVDRHADRHESKRDQERSTQERTASSERATDDDRADHSPVVSDATSPTETDTETATVPAIEEVLHGWRPGRSTEKREEQRAAGRAALEWLREREVANAAEFRADLEPEHPVSGQSPSTWWKKTAREALKRAQEADLVEYIAGRGEWEWRGD